jgi:hypothetical protein
MGLLALADAIESKSTESRTIGRVPSRVSATS